MKILLRTYNGKEYVWKDAGYKKGILTIDEGVIISPNNIVSVIDDDRKQYVKCSACGKILAKDSPEVEEHKNRYKDTRTCMKCSSVRAQDVEVPLPHYESIGDNKYRKTIENIVRLKCSRTWYNAPDIGTEAAHEICRYKACANATYEEITDIFREHPGVFDDIITIDKLLCVGYKSASEPITRGNLTGYRLNGRNKIYAMVNKSGIVDRFFIQYGRSAQEVFYSKKLDKLFVFDRETYVEWNPALSDSVKAYMKNKIAELYN